MCVLVLLQSSSKDKKKSPEKRRDRSSSRDRYESSSKRKDKEHRSRSDREYREKDRSSKHDRDDRRSDRDKRDKYSSSSSSRYKDDRRTDKYERSRDHKRDYDSKDRRYRRSSSRDRKRKSSPERSSRRRSRSRSKSPAAMPPAKPHYMPNPPGVGLLPTPLMPIPTGPLPLINPTAHIQPLMSLNLGPVELPTRPGTTIGGGLPIDATTAALSRSSLIRSNVKAAQLEKMGIDVLQQSKKATESVPLPSYYNPGVVNPVRYADQVQKRKLLWSHKTPESKDVSSNISKWEQAKFSQDKDGKVASKFLRLMGVKDGQKGPGEATKSDTATSSAGGAAASASSSSASGGDSIKKQEELFSTMEQQYEVARQVTHTMRGVGLGFSSQPRTF